MVYEYERDIPKFLKGIEYEHPLDLSKEIKELQEVYRKAKAFDEISKYVKWKLSAEAPLDDDYLIGRFESYETIQELMERADDER
ncbi:hypothetical protein NGB25_00140 [Staphylococcus saprophyticus]|uniref:hypothetical protein n=1 Tax=Staphylococcus saprophyticus TaxID=29385 RepID=UPI002DBA1316|nr:hypothetical protein [Staphylococcus saprophyticus]MEB7675566.1 hypothetical protein [Staphylococcus saprophyticus]